MKNYQAINIDKTKKITIPTTSVLIVSIFTTCVTIINRNNAPSGYENMWLIPLSYGILFYCTNIRYALFRYLGISILNLLLMVRYIILPLFSAVTGLYFHSYAATTHGDINEYAIILMIYEMFCIFIVLHFAIRRLDTQQIMMTDDIKIIYDTKYLVYITVIIIGIISFLYFPEIKERLNFLIIEDIEIENLNTFSSIGFLFTVNTVKVFFLLFLCIEYNKHLKGHRQNTIFILLIALINISIYWTTNRLSVLAEGIATIALLKITNLIGKKISNSLIVIIIIIIFSMSSYRMFGYGNINSFFSDTGNYFSQHLISDYLQSYFGGLHLISLSLTDNNLSFFNNFKTFFNEILGSIFFVRQIFPLSDNSSTVIFNHFFGYYLNQSMILPTLGQSYVYFGILGAPLLSIIFSLFLYKAEKSLMMCETIGEKYAYLILVIWLSFFPIQNLNIVTATYFNLFLPLYIIVVANKRYKLI